MSININQCRARIGSFIQKVETVRTGSTIYYRYLNIINFKVILFFCILLLSHGDIEVNSGPNTSSCIDLIFTDQPNLVVDSGVHTLLHPNCHHQIIQCKFNLFIEYPLPYKQQVWDYKFTDTGSIKKSRNQVNWNQLFQSKNVNAQVAVLNNIILNIFSYFVLNKILTFDDRELPSLSEYIK